MQLDTVIFGGGAAGLWLLDTLVRRGANAVLLEAGRLGDGQTVASQGIIHGGLKYTLRGAFTASAASIREMPRVWSECLAGARLPDLRGVRLRAAHCHMWRTDSLASRLGMIGARVGLRVTPTAIDADERPAVLGACPGTVARVDEPVIAPDSLITTLFAHHRDRVLAIHAERGLDFELDPRAGVRSVRLASHGCEIVLEPRQVVLAAGKGNAALRGQLGLDSAAMQCRPLHMVLARGDLPTLNGHCVDGAATRVTVTTDRDASGRPVWQIGGQIAEKGVAIDERTLVSLAKSEIEAAIPGIRLTGIEWSTYRVDRAEGAMPGGARPDTIQVLREKNVITAWPTKLALAPVLAESVADQCTFAESRCDLRPLADWPRPEVAVPPWESAARNWIADGHVPQQSKAA